MYQQIFELHSDILKALSHPKRLEIIHLLRDHSLSVSEIQEMLDLPQANLSQHLQVLRENHIVITSKKGKQIFYQVAHPNYIKACDLIREVLFERNQNGKLNHDLQNNLSDLLPIGIDPICGMRLTPSTAAFAYAHEGSTHYFCASGCLEKYKLSVNKGVAKSDSTHCVPENFPAGKIFRPQTKYANERYRFFNQFAKK